MPSKKLRKVTFSVVLPCSVTAWVESNDFDDLRIVSVHDVTPAVTTPRGITERMTYGDLEAMRLAASLT